MSLSGIQFYGKKVRNLDSRFRGNDSHRVGLVPTMGALHEGHFSLIRRSLNENQVTVVSLFVNPTQFCPKEDLSRYPRPWIKDKKALEKLGVQILFAPSAKSLYSPSHSTQVSVAGVTNTLCGAPLSRGPHHFIGVATIVAKLFNIVRPHRAYFGMKDFQQLRVIETLNEDLNFGIQIVRCPTVRESDGLALSSRNVYLTSSQRRAAPRLASSLQYGRNLLRSKPMIHLKVVHQKVKSLIRSIPGSQLDYLELVDPHTLQKLKKNTRPVLIAAAIRMGKTRLIDNVLA